MEAEKAIKYNYFLEGIKKVVIDVGNNINRCMYIHKKAWPAAKTWGSKPLVPYF